MNIFFLLLPCFTEASKSLLTVLPGVISPSISLTRTFCLKVRTADPACLRPTVADCVSVRLDMSLLVNTSIGEEVQLPEGPSLKLVRRNLQSAVFQVVRYFWPTGSKQGKFFQFYSGRALFGVCLLPSLLLHLCRPPRPSFYHLESLLMFTSTLPKVAPTQKNAYCHRFHSI